MTNNINFNFNLSDAFAEALSSATRFNTEFWNAFTESYPIYLSTVFEYNKSWKDLSELDRVLRSKFRKALDEKFREQKFVNSLSDTVASYSKLAKIMGLGEMYQGLSNRSSIWNNQFIEPISLIQNKIKS
jgi:hypothetical protein